MIKTSRTAQELFEGEATGFILKIQGVLMDLFHVDETFIVSVTGDMEGLAWGPEHVLSVDWRAPFQPAITQLTILRLHGEKQEGAGEMSFLKRGCKVWITQLSYTLVGSRISRT